VIASCTKSLIAYSVKWLSWVWISQVRFLSLCMWTTSRHVTSIALMRMYIVSYSSEGSGRGLFYYDGPAFSLTNWRSITGVSVHLRTDNLLNAKLTTKAAVISCCDSCQGHSFFCSPPLIQWPWELFLGVMQPVLLPLHIILLWFLGTGITLHMFGPNFKQQYVSMRVCARTRYEATL
jgi:hypothetical protein